MTRSVLCCRRTGFYPQALDEFSANPSEAGQYDVVLFYTMHQIAPNDANRLPWYQKRFFDTLDALRPEQGVGVLHHGLVAFPDWPLWSELVGIEDRKQITPHFDQTVEVTVADADHPITRGLPPVWTLHDETYVMAEPSPESGNHPLLTTAHTNSMKTLAWTRAFAAGACFAGKPATTTMPLATRTSAASLPMPCAGWPAVTTKTSRRPDERCHNARRRLLPVEPVLPAPRAKCR
jgi:hypothetical protein